MQPLRSINNIVTFHNSQGEAVRGTLIHLQRHALVMEVYTPSSIAQIGEVLRDLAIRSGDQTVYTGRATVSRLLNTGLMAIVSVTLVDDWSEVNIRPNDLTQLRTDSQDFVQEWSARFQISQSYQVVVSELRAFLAETSRWIDQIDISTTLPREENGGCIRKDVFYDLATPIMDKIWTYLNWLEQEGRQVPAKDAVAHGKFAQAVLHPLLLRAPFVHRTFVKPLGYAGDYAMMNQMLDDPAKGDSTYFQVVNAAFLHTACAQSYRNRIDTLTHELLQVADAAVKAQRPFRVLNIGCGPAAEIQRFIAASLHADTVCFTLIDFNEATLKYARSRIDNACEESGRKVQVQFINQSVHELLKRDARTQLDGGLPFDFIYCAGLFDYLSDKVCSRLLQYFMSLAQPGGNILIGNMHSCNPQKILIEHLLDWHLIYRDEQQMEKLLPAQRHNTRIYTDATGVNVFAQFQKPVPGFNHG